MAEKIVSPGVFTNEIDQSFLPAAIADIGACIIGPTVKGPAMIPTVVSSYSEFQQKFGDVFVSGSTNLQYLTSHTAEQYLKNSDTLTVVRIMDGDFLPASADVTGSIYSSGSHYSSGSGHNLDYKSAPSFTLTTLNHGALLNNAETTATENGILNSGSKDNFRWEVSSVNERKGTFTVLIRRGDDSDKRKQILETYSNVTLDPNTTNYIGKAIGDQSLTVRFDENSKPFLQLSGSYPNKSKYVRVGGIRDTLDYLDENGAIRVNGASASLPNSGSGSSQGGFSGGDNGDTYAILDRLGNVGTGSAGNSTNYEFMMYEKIESANSQGLNLSSLTHANGGSAYADALNLLANQDEYDINLILVPGVIAAEHSAIASKVIDVCEDRGDCFAVLDPVLYSKNVGDATTEAETRDSNYAAMYWPWIKVPDSQVAGTQRWVPPSVCLGGIIAFNDKVAHPWFAPAGLNRGGIDVAIQAERKLTQADRDSLYDSNVNPIATFPGQGVTVFGQKTLQKKSSALDRVNVRRLLIKVKKFIASSSRFLVFEQNTAATRRRFLSIANPFLEQVQSQSGLNAFRVVMDDTNNTPDTIDRNQLVGQIFLQPTRTAEFIVLDFTVQPTGASFPE